MNKHRILVFDVETTGLLPKVVKVPVELSKEPTVPSEPNPYIIQFSFILYNLQTRSIERKHDFYINPPIDIPEKITEITGITKEMCVEKGVPLILALDCFYDCYTMSNTVIAHNMAFDSAMVKIELERNKEEIEQLAYYCFNLFDATFEQSRGIDRFCTMRYSTNICNIMVSRVSSAARLNPSLPLEVSRAPKEPKEPSLPLVSSEDQSINATAVSQDPNVPVKVPAKYKKWPTLLEFHQHLFNSVPENLHNSIVDVLVCLRCFLKSYKRIVIEDAEFAQMQKYLVSTI
jgi:DNA polymerase III epsilon subunit-like protein